MKPVDRTTLARVLAVAAAGIGLVLATLARAVGWHEFPAPFYWLDVALVYFLAALPLAATLAVMVLPTMNAGKPNWYPTIAVGIAALLFVPNLYVCARTQHDIGRLIGYVQQSRYGEASQLIHRTINLAPQTHWKEQPLSSIAKTIDEVVARLERSTAAALPADATDEQLVQRAAALAMLGRTSEALLVLNASSKLVSDPEACNLRGTIYETGREWQIARDWYSRGKAAWQPLADSPDRSVGLARAVTGIAFCERKVGHLREAEAAWQELLSLAPTADTHFLLAQFYEDTQQTEKSQFHVQQAMKLNPKQYVEPGRQLLSKLVTSHFGCVGIVNTPNPISR